MVCKIAGCEKRARSRGWCPMHYERWRRRDGDLGPAGKLSGPDHRHWKPADDITYSQAHWRVERLRGLATEWGCVHCAAPAEHWAYTHTAENELISPEGWPYSTDPDDYIPLCSSCHKTLDWSHTRQEVSI